MRDLGILAPFLLEEALLAVAERELGYRRSLGREVERGARDGAIFPLVAWGAGLEDLVAAGILRSAFTFPVTWKRGAPDDPRLPRGFRDLAPSIREMLEEDAWGLQLAVDADLSGLNVGAESAGPLLAAALLLARDGRAPRPDVGATAAFAREGGPRGVDSLPAKLALARSLGVRTLFVAPGNQVEADRESHESMAIDRLEESPELRRALRPLLVALEAPPGSEAPMDERIGYHGRLRLERAGEARTYYEERLLPDLLDRIEANSGHLARWKGAVLVTFLSLRPEVALFAARALRPAVCLLLHSRESDPAGNAACARVRDRIESLGCRVEALSYEDPRSDAQSRAVRRRVDETPGDIVVDITPGQKHVGVALLELIGERASAVVYLEQGWIGRDRRPGRESLRLIRPRDDVSQIG